MSKPRIARVWIEKAVDSDPDLSWLGEYGDTAETEWAVDRRDRGDAERGQYRFWNPGPNHLPPGDAQHWAHVDDEQVAAALVANGLPADVGTLSRSRALESLDLAYIEQDYQRCESYNREDWWMVGIIAKAEVVVNGVVQVIHSGGLWGIESDAGDDYLASVAQEELSDLGRQLADLGLRRRAIAHAIKGVESD